MTEKEFQRRADTLAKLGALDRAWAFLAAAREELKHFPALRKRLLKLTDDVSDRHTALEVDLLEWVGIDGGWDPEY